MGGPVRSPSLARRAGSLWLAALLLWSGPAAAAGLAVWAGEPARPVLHLALEPGQTIQLEHRNSIYDAPVRETYVLDDKGRLIQVELASPSAGVFEYYGFDPPPGGKVALHQEVAEIRLLSMSYQHHLLRWGERSLRLEGLARPGEVLGLKPVTP